MGWEAQACPWHLLPNATTVHKCQLMIAMIFSNHDPHISNDDLEIMRGYCGKWNSLYSSLKPIKLLGHRKVVGPSLYVKGKA